MFKNQKNGVPAVLRVEEKLRQALEPAHIQLLSQISKLQGGVKDIVDMRNDLLVRSVSRYIDCDQSSFSLKSVTHKIIQIRQQNGSKSKDQMTVCRAFFFLSTTKISYHSLSNKLWMIFLPKHFKSIVWFIKSLCYLALLRNFIKNKQ